MKFTPRDPNYQQKVTDSFQRQEFMKHLGAKLGTVAPGYCEISVPYQKSLTQQHGYFHAGVISSLADNAAGYAAFSLMEASSSIVTVEFKINLLAPGKGEHLIAKASVIKSGRTLTICRVDVFNVNEGAESLCAAAQATLMQLQNKEDKPEE